MTRMLTVDQAVEALRSAGWTMSRSTLYELVRSGEVPSVRLGSRIRISQHALEPFMGEPQ